jgi:hypothetical protein
MKPKAFKVGIDALTFDVLFEDDQWGLTYGAGITAATITAAASLGPAWGTLGIWRWVVICGAILAGLAMTLQYVDSREVVVRFSEAAWEPSDTDDSYFLDIPPQKHRRGTPAVQVFLDTDGYEVVECDVETMPDRCVRLAAGLRFKGRARVLDRLRS